MSNYFANADLLKVPSKRAAFSDRTAYLMAEMSRLAYFKFEGGSNIEDILDQVRSLFPGDDRLAVLEPLLRSNIVGSDGADAEEALRLILRQSAGFELIKTFDCKKTDAQAFLCVNTKQKMAILSFRGTEPKLKDIKTDIKARLKVVEDGDRSFEIHRGYLNQFMSLRGKISNELAKPPLGECQLFITGHSLGGALAITAVKFLASDITGACYTFGSPPVGTKDFDFDIKTPIYRIINHVDIVPRLPSPVFVWVLRGVAIIVGLLLTPLTGVFSEIKKMKWYKSLRELLLDAQRYRQSGYGSYLVGEGTKARLRYSVGPGILFGWWIKQIPNLLGGEFKMLSDHSIEVYSRKLANWAESRA